MTQITSVNQQQTKKGRETTEREKGRVCLLLLLLLLLAEADLSVSHNVYGPSGRGPGGDKAERDMVAQLVSKVHP